jgi:radical SAM-linked protein
MTRIRVTFSKTEAMRFTSHLDLYKTWERAMRRAGLPLVYRRGFNPRPRLQLACALPLGFTSDCEVLDAWLNDHRSSEEEIAAALERAAPPGITVHSVQNVDPAAPALQTQIQSAIYLVILLEHVFDLEQRVKKLLLAGDLPRQRRGKPYDLRPLIESLEILPAGTAGQQRLGMRLAAEENHTGRPEEVLSALGVSPLLGRIHRTGLILRARQIVVKSNRFGPP